MLPVNVTKRIASSQCRLLRFKVKLTMQNKSPPFSRENTLLGGALLAKNALIEYHSILYWEDEKRVWKRGEAECGSLHTQKKFFPSYNNNNQEI